MIYTITLNPALDYVVRIPEFEEGAVLRTTEEMIFAGGKGINVSIVLANLGIKSTAMGFIAGFTGEVIENMLSNMSIDTDFVRVGEGFSRINVKIKAEKETEINAKGPKANPDEVNELMSKLDKLKDGDILIIAGSVPSGLTDIYVNILDRLNGKNIKIIADTTGSYLTDLLKYKPFLIKPNNFELGEIFGKTLNTDADIAHYAKKLTEMGAQNVYVSMGGDGAMLVPKQGDILRLPAPKGKLVNSTGAGDSSVAGFVAGYLEKGDLSEAMKLGVAAGSATAFSDGLATKNDIYKLLNRF